MKKLLIFIISMLFLSVIILPTQADDSIIIENFEGETNNLTWVALGAVDEINTVNISEIDKTDFVLRADGAATDFSNHRKILASFEFPQNLSIYKSLSYTVFADRITDGSPNCFAKTTIYSSSGEQLEFITSFDSGRECEIILDISNWNGSSDVESIEIAVIPDYIESGVWSGGFYIDDLSVLPYPSNDRIDRFLFEEYSIEGGRLEFADDNSYFDLILFDNSSFCTFEFDVASYVPAFTDTLRFDIENYSDCEEISFAFSDLNTFTKDIKVGIDTLNHKNFYNVKNIKEGFNRHVRMNFYGNGKIRFYSLGFLSSYVSKSYITYGDITDCSLTSDKKQIVISGEIGREYVTEFSDCKLYLYALDLNQRAQDFDYASATPIAEHGMSTKFKFAVNADTDHGDPMFKKYVVKISSKPMVFVDTPTYISTKSVSSALTKKTRAGLISDNLSMIGKTASGMTIVDVSLDKLISNSHSGHMLLSSGRSSYFDKGYVALLDSKISSLNDSGVEIALRLTVDASDSPYTYPGLYQNSDRYLINVQSESGYYALISSVEFLTERYNGQEFGKISSYIIGNAVNSGVSENGAPMKSITDFITSYADTMRLVSLCAGHSNTSIKVYASLCNIYEYSLLNPQKNIFDTSDFIDGLYAYINDEGYFPWGICIEDISRPDLGKVISPENIEVFESFLNSKPIKEISRSVPVIIVENPGENIETAFNSYITAADLGFSGIYIYKSNDSNFFAFLEYFNTGNAADLTKLGVDTEIYSKNIGKSIPVAQKSTGTIYDTLPASIMGRYVYYDFNTYTGIGSWRKSFFATDVKVISDNNSQLLEIKTDKSRFAKINGTSYSGAGAEIISDFNLSLTPILSFDISARCEDKTSDDRAEILVRFIADAHIYEAYSYIPYNTDKTLYLNLKGFESTQFKYMQILIRSEKDEGSTLYVDNIIGYSSDYNDESLSKVIDNSNSPAPIEGERTIDMNIIAFFIVVLALLVTVTILSILVFKKNK